MIYNIPLSVYNEMNTIKELLTLTKAIVYTTSTCPYCTMMTNYLQEQNIPFEEVNVQIDVEAAQKLVAETGEMGVPQTKLNGQWILGFNPDAVQKALAN